MQQPIKIMVASTIYNFEDNISTICAKFYRYHFKNYFEEEDFNKHPLPKLTKDIYLKMKEINDLI